MNKKDQMPMEDIDHRQFGLNTYRRVKKIIIRFLAYFVQAKYCYYEYKKVKQAAFLPNMTMKNYRKTL